MGGETKMYLYYLKKNAARARWQGRKRGRIISLSYSLLFPVAKALLGARAHAGKGTG